MFEITPHSERQAPPGRQHRRALTRPTARQRQIPRLRLVQPIRATHPVLAQRDPDLIRRIFPTMAWVVDHYFRTEVQGIENLSDRACLTVSTHNGGIATPDMYCLMVAFWRRFGLETPAYGMMHKIAFKIPLFGSFLSGLGAIYACRKNAQIVLQQGYPVLICPGGDIDSLKPFWHRHRIVFGQRRGFVRLAIRQQVPIVPVVSVGAHETCFVLNDGRWLAEVTGLSRFFRIKTAPLTLGFPFGLTPGSLLSIPLPSKIVQRVLPKIELDEPPSAADDERVVQRCFDHVVQTMQRALEDLASRRRRIILG
jgi:1-acyl-sn-glycerol-3-phosphate acyltransferase